MSIERDAREVADDLMEDAKDPVQAVQFHKGLRTLRGNPTHCARVRAGGRSGGPAIHRFNAES